MEESKEVRNRIIGEKISIIASGLVRSYMARHEIGRFHRRRKRV